MDRMKVFVCALFGALVLGFAGIAGAQQWDAIDDETPYIDAEGNFDYDVAKEYAELVDSYVDEFGNAWDVWLDEFGGQMWGETAESSIVGAEEFVSASGGGNQLLVIHFLLPDYIYLYHHTTQLAYYNRSGDRASGYIVYADSDCPDDETNCQEWEVWDYGGTRANVTKISGRASSTNNYCDGYYDGWYGDPNSQFIWIQPDSASCNASSPYYYYVTDDDIDHGEYHSEDYPTAWNDYMLKYEYRVSSTTHRTEITWGGVDPE